MNALFLWCSAPVTSDYDLDWALWPASVTHQAQGICVEHCQIAPGPIGPQKTVGAMPIPFVCCGPYGFEPNPSVVIGIGGPQ
jgi:hypothetical protein